MGENTVVPVIDLQGFPAAGETRKLIEACEEWGCFRLVNYGEILPAWLMSEMKHVVKSLFDLPPEIKKRNTDNVIPGSGYMSPTPTNPLYEAFGLYDMSSPQDVQAFCTHLDASPHQRDTILKYSKALQDLMREIGKKLGEGLGLKGDDLFKGWACKFRINKYHFAPENVGSSGVQIHTDSGFLTILHDDESVGGLEVMNKSGEFVAVDPWPGSLLLNLGDTAAVWSNGRFRNVRHRVMCKEASIRLSIASFLLGPREDVIETPAEFLGTDQLCGMYIPITYKQLRNLRHVNNMHAGEVLALVQRPDL